MNGDHLNGPPGLEPLAYHKEVVAHLRAHEAQIWSWAASHETREDHARETRALLLRETYRLDPDAHAEAHADCAEVRASLDIDAPATLYQASDGSMNAALCHIPGEIHLIFHGPVLEKLSRLERMALIGHELAHYKLWSIEDGAYHTASRILDHALAYSGASPSHIETARIYRLHTELYADRGGAIAAGAHQPAIAVLVKTMTGLAAVDADSYLRQAAELDSNSTASRGETHPEIFLRAQALDKWRRREEGLERWLASRIRGPMSMASLDLARQHELTALTRAFLARLVSEPATQSEAIAAQVRRYFPDWNGAEAPVDLAALSPERIDDSIRDYLAALIFDIATADLETRDAVLAAGAQLARSFGAADSYRAGLMRDLKLTRKAADKYLAQRKEAAA